VTDWAVVFLGVMAVCLVIMTAIQIGLIVAGLRVAKQTTAAIDDLRRELRPLSEKINRIADDAARATSLAALQVERIDQMMSSTASRLDDTLGVVQGLMSGPVKGGATAIAVFRAAFSLFREWKGRSQRARTVRDDDEALFVG
jgi:predicted PurR-regulated permease PerM